MTPDERLGRLDGIIRQARATGNAEAHTEAVGLLLKVIRYHADAVGSATAPDPMTRAHARVRDASAKSPQVSGQTPADDRTNTAATPETATLHQLRKGRDRCGATRRDGQPCQAPTIPEGLVCRRHGGAAPQVAIRARYMELLVARYAAWLDWEAARGTPGEFDALCRSLQAGRELDAYEVKMRLLAELKAERKRRQATGRAGPQEALNPTPRKDRAK